MATYPKFTTSKNGIFNNSDIISSEESNNGQATISLDLSSFVTKSNPVFNSDIYLASSTNLNFNGQVQESPYSETEKLTNNNNKAKLTNISFDNNATVINNDLDLTNSTLLLNDESISQSKILNLLDRLEEIDENLLSINNNDNDISLLQAENTTQETKITSLQTDSTLYSLEIQDIEDDITNNIKPDIINLETQLNNSVINIVDNLTKIELNKINVENNDTDILNIQNNVIEVENDIVTNLNLFNVQKTLTDSERVTLLVDLEAIDTSIVDLTNENISQETKITNLETTKTLHISEIQAIEDDLINNVKPDIVTNLTSINTLNTLTTAHTANLSQLDGLTTSNLSDITSLENQQGLNNTDITNLKSDMLTKQPTITSSVRLDCSKIGNGDVSSDKLSALNDVSTVTSIQSQINTINNSLGTLNNLQDIDLTNIPLLQTDVSALQTKATTNDANILTINNLISTKNNIIDSNNKLPITSVDVSSINTTQTNLQNGIDTNSTAITALINSDSLTSTELTSLTAQNVILENNINLKQDLLSLSNKLNSTLLFDTTQNDSLDNILSTISNNIDVLDNNKQDALNGVNKLNSLYIDLSTTSLGYVDITAPLKAQITAINSAILTLQNITTNDTISTFQTIEDNFDALELTKLNQSVYDLTIAPEIININNALSTLSSLQSGDVTSFNTINNNITNLTNTKHPLISNAAKLNSSLLNRDDSLQYVDVSSSIDTSLTNLQNNINLKQNIIDTNNKVNISNVDLGVSALSHVDISSSLQTKLNNLDTSISNLNNYDVSQSTLNTGYTNNLATQATSITDLEAYDTAQTTINANVATSITDLEAYDTAQTTINTNVTTSITDLEAHDTAQTTINAGFVSSIDTLTNAIPPTKIELIDESLSYTTPTNILTHTFNQENIFLNQLDDNDVITLDLTITSPENYKSYVQNVIVDCLEFKGYIHTLKINTETVEIKYKDGDTAINLAPIAGWSSLIQSFNMTRMNNEWYVMSDVKLFFNSNSNSVYDVTPPIITLIGGANINHEINSGAYSDAGATCNDNIGGDLTGSLVIDASTVNVAVLGSYNVLFDCVDGAGNNAVQKIRVVNVIDTTNPVVTIIGDVEKTINQGNSYVEEGATASDNSNESLSVVITGSVDINTVGDYTLTYEATDSNSNTHALTRLIHIISGPVIYLKYSNPTTDIISGLIGFSSYLNAIPASTQETFVISGNVDAYKNGTYITEVSNYHYDTVRNFNYGFHKCLDNINTGAEFYSANVTDHGYYLNYPIIHHIHGTLTMTNNSYRDTGSGFQYYGCDTNEIGLYHVSTTDTNATTYNGEYFQITFPFYLELSRIDIYMGDAGYLFREGVMLGSVDDGATWEYITTIGNGSAVTAYDISVVTSLKYKTFRVVITKAEPSQGRNYMLRTFKLFGDVYN